MYRIRRYIEGKKHCDYACAAVSQVPIKAPFEASSASVSFAHQVTAAEVYFITFITEHNIPCLAADHFYIQTLQGYLLRQLYLSA